MRLFVRKEILVTIVLIALLSCFIGCSSPEEKTAKFFDKGMALFESEDYVKAELAFKNAPRLLGPRLQPGAALDSRLRRVLNSLKLKSGGPGSPALSAGFI